jgi:hypothetical protein
MHGRHLQRLRRVLGVYARDEDVRRHRGAHLQRERSIFAARGVHQRRPVL